MGLLDKIFRPDKAKESEKALREAYNTLYSLHGAEQSTKAKSCGRQSMHGRDISAN